MKFRTADVNGVRIFYRESGEADKPVMVLFHGFPSASHMFRDLIPMLEKDFHLIAPDYPGFGNSESPSRERFDYTFDNIAELMDSFLKALQIDRFYMYVFDYGAPIGFRIAMKRPDSILGIISQNGNVYEEGLGKKWEARAEYWKNPTEELRKQYQSAFARETVIGQYTFGTEEGSVSPDGYSLDLYYASVIDDYAEKQSDLIFDYQNNVKLYPAFQDYLRTYKPGLLAIWGKEDPSFIWAGAEAFRKDLPQAVIIPVNSGHFALENCCAEIASEILRVFAGQK
ncbi:MAG: alpha/beta hydrolase [Erysipelotrichaceae bacterium]|nr:alpha/beta hydrolase [Erysipelotrichaceae bacterium]